MKNPVRLFLIPLFFICAFAIWETISDKHEGPYVYIPAGIVIGVIPFVYLELALREHKGKE